MTNKENSPKDILYYLRIVAMLMVILILGYILCRIVTRSYNLDIYDSYGSGIEIYSQDHESEFYHETYR